MGVWKLYEILLEGGFLVSCGFNPPEEEATHEQIGMDETDSPLRNITAAAVGKKGTDDTSYTGTRNYNATSLNTKTTDPEGGVSKGNRNDDNDENEEPETNCLSEMVKNICQYFLDPFVLEVVVYALVVSSDNIGIYITLFSSLTPVDTGIVIGIFYALLGFNIFVAFLLMQVINVPQPQRLEMSPCHFFHTVSASCRFSRKKFTVFGASTSHILGLLYFI